MNCKTIPAGEIVEIRNEQFLTNLTYITSWRETVDGVRKLRYKYNIGGRYLTIDDFNLHIVLLKCPTQIDTLTLKAKEFERPVLDDNRQDTGDTEIVFAFSFIKAVTVNNATLAEIITKEKLETAEEYTDYTMDSNKGGNYQDFDYDFYDPEDIDETDPRWFNPNDLG